MCVSTMCMYIMKLSIMDFANSEIRTMPLGHQVYSALPAAHVNTTMLEMSEFQLGQFVFKVNRTERERERERER